MSQQIIVTTPQNSGDGSPLATAFNYCNDNFSELYSRVQTTPPASLIGAVGDTAGMYAYDETYFYYCYANYDGVNTVWGQVTQVGNVSVSAIISGTSNVKLSDVNGNATFSINGVSNVVVVAPASVAVNGVINAVGNITGDYILGNGSALTGLPQSYTNANVAAFLPVYTGNIAAGNIATTNRISATGNVTGGNVTTSGQVSATGNIVTDQYFVGNFFGNITGNFTIPGSNTQVVFNTNGNADAVAGLTFNTAGPNLLTVLGTISSTGNVQSGNLRTTGLISATGNITGGNVSATSITGTLTTAAQPNITSVGTLSSLTVTANVSGGNITTGGQISAAGNIRTAGYLFATQDVNVGGDITATSYTGASSSLSGNVVGGNLLTGGRISAAGNITTTGNITATGNITGSFVLGNGSQLTGLLTNTIQNGNSNVLISTAAGNVSINVNGVSPVTLFNPLGQILNGTLSATDTISGGNLLTNGQMSATGDVRGANVRTNGVVTATGNITTGGVLSATGNILSNGIVSATGDIFSSGVVSATGNIICGNIINNNANGVGNIGSATRSFNTVFAKATSAQYADLAEIYLADADYVAGTVVIFGGDMEITVCQEAADERVAGVISTEPAHLMNAGQQGLPVALRGRVPVNVIGPVVKGDSLVTSSTVGYAQSVGRDRSYGQAVFAKALETSTDPGEKTITAVIL
jgi:hypothetical protein